jgi:hypothetical protein
VDREGLWYHVLVVRYGEIGGRLEDGGRRCSSWWREVGRIRDGNGGVGGVSSVIAFVGRWGTGLLRCSGCIDGVVVVRPLGSGSRGYSILLLIKQKRWRICLPEV